MLLFLATLLFFSSCGLRTSPSPRQEITSSSFEELQARQYGEKIRLSWKKSSSSSRLQQKTLDQKEILIEEFALEYACPACTMQQIRELRLSDSSPEFIRTENQIYLDLEPSGDQNQLHFFRFTRLSLNQGKSRSQLVEVPAYIDFPALTRPQIRLVQVTSSSVQRNYHFRIAWKKKRETAEFQLSGTGELLKNEVFFKVNLYQKFNNDPWKEGPLNSKPIQQDFFLHTFSQKQNRVSSLVLNVSSLVDNHPSSLSLKAALQMDYQSVADDILLYRMRWISSTGNQSNASESTQIRFPRLTSLGQHFLLPLISD